MIVADGSPVTRQALVAAHLLAAVAVAAWFGLIAFEAGWAAVVVGLAGALACVAGWFAAHRGRRRAAWTAAAVWMAAALIGGHLLVAGQSGIWKGFRLDAELGWYPIAGQTNTRFEGADGTYRASTDALGHRNARPYPADGVLPVIVQGDSNIFGFGLADGETFCERWTVRGGAACFNVGVPGFDPQHYLVQHRALNRRGFEIKRRVVIFNVGNDYAMAALSTPYLLPRPYLFLVNGKRTESGPIAQPFQRQVYGHHFIPPLSAFDFGLTTVTLGRDWNGVPPAIEAVPLVAMAAEKLGARTVALYTHIFARDAERQGKVFNPYYPNWQMQVFDAWPEPYRLYAPHFRALMAAIGEQPAGETVVVLMPMKERVVPARREAVLATLPSDTIDPDALSRFVAAAAEAGGMRVIDPTAAFLAHPDAAALYQSDGHLSAAGMDLLVGETLRALP